MVDSNDDGTLVNRGATPMTPDPDEPADEVDEANALRFSEEEQLIREQSGEEETPSSTGPPPATEA